MTGIAQLEKDSGNRHKLDIWRESRKERLLLLTNNALEGEVKFPIKAFGKIWYLKRGDRL